MQKCIRCAKLIRPPEPPSQDLCVSCLQQLLESIAGPKIQTLLASLSTSVEQVSGLHSPLRLVDAWRTCWGPQQEGHDVSSDDAGGPFDERCRAAHSAWRKFQEGIDRYEKTANTVEAAIEFILSSRLAVLQRRLYRRYFHCRWRYDIRRGRFLRGARAPQNRYEIGVMIVSLQMYGLFSRVVET